MIALVAAAWGASQEQVVAQLVVVTPDRAAVGDALVAKAEAAGGWFESRDPAAVTLRVPAEHADELLKDVAGQGRVIQRQVDRTDVSGQIGDLASRIDSTRAVLERYYRELGNASQVYTLQLEHSLDGAIDQLEQLEGDRRKLDQDTRYASIQVAFQLADRTPPSETSSPFRWIGSLDPIALARWTPGPPDWKARHLSLPAPPAGFSGWGSPLSAVSPDGVTFRVRLIDHVQRATSAFWGEAVQQDLVQAGYRWLGQDDLTAGPRSGKVSEVAMPIGDQDWEYLVAFVPAGRRMVVVEVVGEIGAVGARRDAILAALADVRVE